MAGNHRTRITVSFDVEEGEVDTVRRQIECYIKEVASCADPVVTVEGEQLVSRITYLRRGLVAIPMPSAPAAASEFDPAPSFASANDSRGATPSGLRLGLSPTQDCGSPATESDGDDVTVLRSRYSGESILVRTSGHASDVPQDSDVIAEERSADLGSINARQRHSAPPPPRMVSRGVQTDMWEFPAANNERETQSSTLTPVRISGLVSGTPQESDVIAEERRANSGTINARQRHSAPHPPRMVSRGVQTDMWEFPAANNERETQSSTLTPVRISGLVSGTPQESDVIAEERRANSGTINARQRHSAPPPPRMVSSGVQTDMLEPLSTGNERETQSSPSDTVTPGGSDFVGALEGYFGGAIPRVRPSTQYEAAINEDTQSARRGSVPPTSSQRGVTGVQGRAQSVSAAVGSPASTSGTAMSQASDFLAAISKFFESRMAPSSQDAARTSPMVPSSSGTNLFSDFMDYTQTQSMLHDLKRRRTAARGRGRGRGRGTGRGRGRPPKTAVSTYTATRHSSEEDEVQNECAACYEPGATRQLACTHMFHPDCLSRSIVLRRECPLCRQEF